MIILVSKVSEATFVALTNLSKPPLAIPILLNPAATL